MLSVLTTLSTLAVLSQGPQTIVPENNLYIPEGGKGEVTLTETDFNNILDDINAEYPGEMIHILRDWKDGTVNAYAQIYNEERYIQFFGGFARFPGMTKDAFALVACHEFGHHLGGRPRIPSSWASAEGQADYYGASDCLKRYFASHPLSKEESEEQLVVEHVAQSCQEAYGDDVAKNEACVRGAIAGEKLAVIFAQLEGFSSDFPSLLTPCEYQVSKTIRDKYPSVQCRLDTYFNGSLGLERPGCWYKD